MLPKNGSKDKRMSRLLLFEGPDHPYEANIFKDYLKIAEEEEERLKIMAPPDLIPTNIKSAIHK